jgi:penicillin-binding protein 1C
VRFLGRAGLSTFEKTASHYGLGLTLGNAEVRLDELTAAYSALARGGEWLAPTWLTGVPGRASRRVVSQRTAFWVTDILSDDEAREYVFGRGGSLEFPFPVAVKTGTSQAYHDNWTVGYSKHVTVGVWVGNFDRTPLRNSSGVTGAAPIGGLAQPSPDRILPPGPDAAEREICALSGLAANSWCPNRRREWVAAESTPSSCSWHHLGDEGLLTYLPPIYAAWQDGTYAESAGASLRVRELTQRVHGTHAEGLPAGLSAEALAKAEALAEAEASAKAGTGPSRRMRRADTPRADFAIVSPADGATYLIDPTLRREFQRLPLRVAGAAPGSIEWTVDGRPLASAKAAVTIEWPLAAGRHTIAARDVRGRTANIVITVR